MQHQPPSGNALTPTPAALNPLQMLRAVGRAALRVCISVGAFARFTAAAFYACVTPPFYGKMLLRQLRMVGWQSLPVVGLTAVFTGAVLALQIYNGGSRFNAEKIVPAIVLIAVLRELGPVLTGLMTAGRVSAAMAAELGTMRVTEQLDALTTLSVDPMRYLTAPRLLASLIALPLLVLVGDCIAVAGGRLAAVSKLGFNGTVYLNATIEAFIAADLYSGLIKAGIFGGLIALAGCYEGYTCPRGASGVGQAATAAVVRASVLILACNYLVTSFGI